MKTISADQFKQIYGDQGVAMFDNQTNTTNGYSNGYSNNMNQEPSLGQRLQGDISAGRQNIQDIRGSNASGLTKFAEQAATVTGLPLKLGKELLPNFARKGLDIAGQAVGKGVNFLADKISSNPQFQKWAASIPEDKYNQLTDILKGISATGETAGNLATTYGVVKGGFDLGDKAIQGVKNVAQRIKPAINKIGEGVQFAGKKLNETGFDPSAREAEMMQNYNAKQTFLKQQLRNITPGSEEATNLENQLKTLGENKPITVADTAMRQDISGFESGIGKKSVVKQMDLYKNIIEPALDESDTVMTKKDLFSKWEQKIAGTTDPLRKQSLQDGLDAIKEAYTSYPDEFNLKTANNLKTDLAEFTPQKIYKGQDVSNAIQQGKAEMAKAIRQFTYNALKDKNIKTAYLDYSNLKELSKIGVKAATQGTLKGGFGSFWSSLYNKLLTPIKTVGGQTLYKVGDKLVFKGPPGLTTFGEYVASTGQTIKILPYAGTLTASEASRRARSKNNEK